jgi:hypothetical protein
MFKTNKEIFYQALNMWANYIETGDVCLSSRDAIQQERRKLIQSLDVDQQEFVVKLRRLSDRCLKEMKN